MNRVLKKLLYVSGVTLLAFSITSCGSEGKNAAVNSKTEDLSGSNSASKKISQVELDTALKTAVISKDEFIGNYEILFNPRVETQTKIDDSWLSLSGDITKKDEKSDWEFILVSHYFGKDWMFHNEINIKSPNGIVNFNDIISVSRQVLDGGNVSEFSSRKLNEKEIQEYCYILDSNEVQFRLRGNGKVLSQIGPMEESAIIDNRNLCTIYSGLKQGLIITK